MTNSGREPPAAPGWRILAILTGTELLGHEKGHIEVYRSCQRNGHEVLVCVPEQARDSTVVRRLEQLNVPYIVLPLGHRWSLTFIKRHPWLPFYNLLCIVRCTWVLLRICRRFGPTHLLIGQETVFSYIWPTLWQCRLPMIYRIGDRPPEESRFARWLWRRCASAASVIVAISDFIQQSVIQLEPKTRFRTVTIHNLSPVTPSAPLQFARAKRNVILYVGQINEKKGLRHIIDAAQLLHQAGWHDTEFHIVGGSEYTRDYEAALRALVTQLGIECIVRFHGRQEGLERFYRSASLHLAPTVTNEPLGNVVLEAKSFGVPSVVFPSGGLPEMVRHQEDGFICSERTAQSLADGIAWCLESDERLMMLSKAAATDAEERFGQERFDRAWDAVLERAAKT